MLLLSARGLGGAHTFVKFKRTRAVDASETTANPSEADMVDAMEPSTNTAIDDPMNGAADSAFEDAVVDSSDAVKKDATNDQATEDVTPDHLKDTPLDIVEFADAMYQEQYGQVSEEVMLQIIKANVDYEIAKCEKRRALLRTKMAKEEKIVRDAIAKDEEHRRHSEKYLEKVQEAAAAAEAAGEVPTVAPFDLSTLSGNVVPSGTARPVVPVNADTSVSCAVPTTAIPSTAVLVDISAETQLQDEPIDAAATSTSATEAEQQTETTDTIDPSDPQPSTSTDEKKYVTRKWLLYRHQLTKIEAKLNVLKDGSKCIHESKPKPKYIDCYDNTHMPPFAKTFYPTAEEFSDPFEYVETIKEEGRYYGVIKIVPPKDFKPPFSLSRDLTFKPRSQRLCITDAFNKEHHMLRAKLQKFYAHDPAKAAVAKFGGITLNLAIFFLAIDDHGVRFDGFEQDAKPCPARSHCSRYLQKVNDARWIAVAKDCMIDPDYAPALQFYYYTVVSKFRAALRMEQILRTRYKQGLGHETDEIYDTAEEPHVDGRKRKRAKPGDGEDQVTTGDAVDVDAKHDDEEVANQQSEGESRSGTPTVQEADADTRKVFEKETNGERAEPEPKKLKLNEKAEESCFQPVKNADQSSASPPLIYNELFGKSAHLLAEPEPVANADQSGESAILETTIPLINVTRKSLPPQSDADAADTADVKPEKKHVPVASTDKKATVEAPEQRPIVPHIAPHRVQRAMKILKRKLSDEDYEAIVNLPEDEKMIFLARLLKVSVRTPRPNLLVDEKEEAELEPVSGDESVEEYDDDVEDEAEEEEEEDASEPSEPGPSSSKPKRKEMMFSIYLNPNGETEMVEEEVEVDGEPDERPLEEQECTEIPFEIAERLLPTRIKAVADEVAAYEENQEEHPELMDTEADGEEEDVEREPEGAIDDDENDIDTTQMEPPSTPAPEDETQSEATEKPKEGEPNIRRSSRRATAAAVQKISTITGAVNRPSRGYVPRPRAKRFKDEGPAYEDPDIVELSKHLPYEGTRDTEPAPTPQKPKFGRRRGRPAASATPVPESTPAPDETDEEREPLDIEPDMKAKYFKSPLRYSLQDFQDEMNLFKAEYFGVDNPKDVDVRDVERAFWKNVGDMNSDLYAFYGADLNSGNFGSGFPLRPKKKELFDAMTDEQKFYAMHPWNLNNMPIAPQSVFHHLEENISGMTIPWVYVGSCFSLFCWHVEDHWTYSINYMHEGETKVWYGVPESCAAKFDSLMARLAPEMSEEFPDLMHHMSTMIHPTVLLNHGIRTYTVHQNVGEIVITFPRAYHGGFNAGYNVAEAVNFAPYDWLAQGRVCLQNYAETSRSCVFAHDDLILSMVRNADKLHPSMYIPICKELSAMILRDNSFRNFLYQQDFEFLRPMISLGETLYNEDVRSCVVCNTLLRGCAVMCKHMRVSCPTHYKWICKRCPPESLHFATAQTPYVLLRMLQTFVTSHPAWDDITEYLRIITHKLTDSDGISTVEDLKAVLNSRRYFPASKYPYLDVFMEFDKAWNDALPALKDFVESFRSGKFPAVSGCGALPEASDAAHVNTEKKRLAEKADDTDSPQHTGESQPEASKSEREINERVSTTATTTTTTYEDIAATTSENIQARNSGSSNGIVRPSPYSLEDLYLANGTQPPSTSVSSGATADVNFLSAHEIKDNGKVATTADSATTPKPMATLRTASSCRERPDDTLTYSDKVVTDRAVDNNGNSNMMCYEPVPEDYDSPGAPMPPPPTSPPQLCPFVEPVPDEYDPPMAPLNRDVFEMKYGPYGFEQNGDEPHVAEHDSESGISSTEPGSSVNIVSTEPSIFSPTDSSNDGVTPPPQQSPESEEVLGGSLESVSRPKRRRIDFSLDESSEEETYHDDIFSEKDDESKKRNPKKSNRKPKKSVSEAVKPEVVPSSDGKKPEPATAAPTDEQNPDIEAEHVSKNLNLALEAQETEPTQEAESHQQASPSQQLKKAASVPAPESPPVSMEVETLDRIRSGSAHNVIIVITPPVEEAEQASKARKLSSKAKPKPSAKATLTVELDQRRRSPRFSQAKPFLLPPIERPQRVLVRPRIALRRAERRRAILGIEIKAVPGGRLFQLPNMMAEERKADFNYPKKRIAKSFFDKTLQGLELIGDRDDPANVYIIKNAPRSRWLLYCYVIWQVVISNTGDGLVQIINRCQKKGLKFNTGRYYTFQIRDLNFLIKEGKEYLNTADENVKVFYTFLKKLRKWAIWCEQQCLRLLFSSREYGIGLKNALAFESGISADFRWLSAKYNNLVYKCFRHNIRIQHRFLQSLDDHHMVPYREFRMRVYYGFVSLAMCGHSNEIADAFNIVTKMVNTCLPHFLAEDYYFKIYEIFHGRQDLVQLAETGKCSYKHLKKLSEAEEFNSVLEFWQKTESMTANSLKHLSELFPKIVERNEDPNHELCSVCVCGIKVTDVDPNSLNTIRCLSCSCAIHTACAQYSNFMGKMAEKHRPGFYMCPRCLRSARPPIEPMIEFAPIKLSDNTRNIEWHTFHLFINHALKAKAHFEQLDHDKLSHKEFRNEANVILNQEFYEEALYNKILNHPVYDSYFTEAQIRRMEIVRRYTAIRRSENFLQPVIFETAVGRPRPDPTPKSSIMSRKGFYFEVDELYCSGEPCLHPPGRVQGYRCISKGCINFYHNMCATWNNNEVDNIEQYQCKDCIAKGIKRPHRPPKDPFAKKPKRKPKRKKAAAKGGAAAKGATRGRKKAAPAKDTAKAPAKARSQGRKAPANPKPQPQKVITKAKNSPSTVKKPRGKK